MRGVVVAVVLLAGCAAPVADEPEPAAVEEPVVQEEPEEEPDPQTSVSLEGDGKQSTEPFDLDAGDYVLEWTVGGDCYYGFDLYPLDDQGRRIALASAGDAESGSDRVYDVEAGSWYLKATTGPAPGCPWTLSLEPA